MKKRNIVYYLLLILIMAVLLMGCGYTQEEKAEMKRYEKQGREMCIRDRCYMDPIMQKHSLTPDQKLRKAMYDMLPVCEAEEKSVSVFGSDFALNESSDIKRCV